MDYITIADKLNYILDTYTSATEVTKSFGFKSNTMISNMRKGQSNISRLHIDGLEKYFNIPTEIFETHIRSYIEIDQLIVKYREEIYKKENQEKISKKILKILENQQLIPPNIFQKEFTQEEQWEKYIKAYKKQLFKETYETIQNQHNQKVFPQNNRLFQKLLGIWYGYIYPSNPASAKKNVWKVKTHINKDYTVVDEPWGNRGYIQLGKHESLIIKESYDNDDLTIIRFPNRQVPSAHFRFVIISNQNNTENEMVNFGFFSRLEYSEEEAQKILGEREKKQLKLDLNFNDRLNLRAVVPQ